MLMSAGILPALCIAGFQPAWCSAGILPAWCIAGFQPAPDSARGLKSAISDAG